MPIYREFYHEKRRLTLDNLTELLNMLGHLHNRETSLDTGSRDMNLINLKLGRDVALYE